MIKQSPDIRVVIPTYNRVDDLLLCVDSLIRAGINQEQVIIVDNHSEDETVQKVQQAFPRVKLFALDKNLGATGASNIGFEYALGEGADFILRLDSDTIVDPNFLQPLVQIAVNDPLVGLVAPKIYYYQPPDEIWYAGADAHPWHYGAIHTHRREKDSLNNSQTREVDYAWGASMLIRGEVLEKTGGFDTDFFVYYEELDFCQRIQKLGYKLMYEPQSHIWHKVGSSAHNAWTAYHWNRSKMLFYRKHARGVLHRVLLVIYAFAYACSDALLHSLSLRRKSGNRGPFKNAVIGLWDGLKQPIGKKG
jgi:GT2 family glycosyltransferase